MVNKHQFQMLAKAFRAGKISLSEFTDQAFNPPAGEEAKSPKAADTQAQSSASEGSASDGKDAQ